MCVLTRIAFFNVSASCLRLSSSFILAHHADRAGAVTEHHSCRPLPALRVSKTCWRKAVQIGTRPAYLLIWKSAPVCRDGSGLRNTCTPRTSHLPIPCIKSTIARPICRFHASNQQLHIVSADSMHKIINRTSNLPIPRIKSTIASPISRLRALKQQSNVLSVDSMHRINNRTCNLWIRCRKSTIVRAICGLDAGNKQLYVQSVD